MTDRASGRRTPRLTPLHWSRLISALNGQSLTREEFAWLQETRALFATHRISLDRFPKQSWEREKRLIELAQKYHCQAALMDG